MHRHLHDIPPASTSYEMGLKRVLLSANESGCSITQIAVIDLKAGEESAMHIHPDLQDAFYILDGELDVTINGTVHHCKKDDFLFVEQLNAYQLQAITDVRMLAMGCVIESQRTKLYPMLFEPNLQTKVWGGKQLTQWKQLPEQQHIGESWEVSAVEKAPSVIANGTWAGYSLTEVINKMPQAVLGKEVAKKYNNQLPLLVKFIDSNDDLSVQVHPNDAMAKRLHNGTGKTEMWYVLSAEPGAYIYAGFQIALSPEEYTHRVANGTIIDTLAKHEIHAGDVFYIPSGRIHAIGKGVRLVEVQQSSDLTYRIYDYNRMDLNGLPRELHTEYAAQALDYKVYREYRSDYVDKIDTANACIDTEYFTVRVVSIKEPIHRNMIKYDSFIILTCTKGQCKIRIRSTQDEITLQEGYSSLIPAAIADYDIIPINGEVKVLESYIDNSTQSTFRRMISQFLHISGV
ncbi:MAG: cupin domain-containing protein [Paludibacteraceae bacterium]|nr:cupin domain-containing protein [Paludibacteraceae bacterium]